MERYASTLATTAACVGLLVAGHLTIVHQRASVPDEPVKARVVAPTSAAAETRAWAEPPAKPDLHATASAAPTVWTAAAVEPEPAATALPAVQSPSENAASKAEVKPDKAKRAAEQARRKRLAQAKVRRAQTASRDVSADQPVIQEAPPQPAPRRIDPIADLLRGLGIGGQG